MSALGSLVINLGLDFARFTGGLDQSEEAALAASKRIQDTMDDLKGRLATTAGAIAGGLAAAFTIGAFKEIISSSIDTGAALDDLRMQTGATVESLSALVAVGKFNDMGPEAIGAAMNKLSSTLAGATQESQGAGKALEALGLDFEKFKQLRPEDQMHAVAKAMAGFEDGAGKSAVAMALYGEEGAKMLPFLGDLAGLGELQAKVTTEQAAASANLDDNLARLTASGDAWKKELASGMIPALDLGAQALVDVISGTGGVREEVRRLAADGSIERWTKAGITGLTYVADAAQYLIRGVQVLGESLGAYAAAGMSYFGGIAKAILLALGGDFSGALDTVRSGASEANTIVKDLGQSMIQSFSEDTIGSRIRARMAEIEATGNTAEAAKPKLDFKNVLEKNAKAAKEAKEPFDALLDSITKRTAASQAEFAAGEKLTESEKTAIDVLEQLRTGKVKLTQVQAVLLGKRLEEMLAAEDTLELHKEGIKVAEAERAERLKLAQAVEQSVATLAAGNDALREEIELIGLTEKGQLDIVRARNAITIATKQATLAELQRQSAITGTMTREQIALEAEIDLLKERNDLLGVKFDRTAVAQAVDEMTQESARFSEEINSALTDALFRGFESGADFAENMADTVVNAFKTMVLRPVISAIVNPVGQMVSGAVGSFGNAAAGQAGTGLLGSLASSTVGTFFSSITTAVSAGFKGATLGVGMMGPTTAGAGGAMGFGNALAAIPGWGWALAGIAALAGLGIGKTPGEQHAGGLFSTSGTTDMATAMRVTGGGGWDDGAWARDLVKRADGAINQSLTQVGQGLVQTLAQINELAGGLVSEFDLTLGFAANLNGEGKDKNAFGYFDLTDKATGAVIASYQNRELGTDNQAAMAKLSDDAARAMLDALAKADVPQWAQNVLKELEAVPGLQAMQEFLAYPQKLADSFGIAQQSMAEAIATGFVTGDGEAAGAALANTVLSGIQSSIVGAASQQISTLVTNVVLTPILSALANAQDPAQALAGIDFDAVITKAEGIGAGLATALNNPKLQDAMGRLDGLLNSVGKSSVSAAGDLQRIVKATKDAGKAANGVTDVITGLLMGKEGAQEAGAQLGQTVINGVKESIIAGEAATIAATFTQSIIQPMINNIMVGADMMAGVDMAGTIEAASQRFMALQQVLNTLDTSGAAAQIQSLFGQIAGLAAAVPAATGGSAAPSPTPSLFAIGGSAVPDRGYQEPAIQAVSSLVTETLESNKRVSELLQELLKPQQDYANRYLELAGKLLEKQQQAGTEGIRAQIAAMQQSFADAQRIMGVVDPLWQKIEETYSHAGYTGGQFSAPFDDLAKLIVERGQYKDGGLFYGDSNTYSYIGTPVYEGQTPEDVVSAWLEGFYSEMDDAGKSDAFKNYLLQFLNVSDVTQLGIDGKITELSNLEKQLREWYIAQARVIAVEDMASLAEEARDAKAQTATLKRTGGLEDPVTQLKESLAAKMQAIDDGIGAALMAEVDGLRGQTASESVLNPIKLALSQKNQLLETLSGDTSGWQASVEKSIQDDQNFLSDFSNWETMTAPIMSGVADRLAANKSLLASLQDGSLLTKTASEITALEDQMTAAMLAATDPEKQQDLLDEIAKYKGGITEWFEAQADLLSTEMLVDINAQIRDLEAAEQGPITAIKAGIQKYIDDLKALGQLTPDAQAQIDKLSGLQLTQARKGLYDQLLTPEEVKTRDSLDLNMQFMGLGAAMPATTDALRDMVDAAQTAGNTTLADSLLELVPAFVSLQGAAAGVASAIEVTAESVQAAYDKIKEASRTAEDVARERITLEDRLFAATATTAEAAARARDAIHPLNQALYDTVLAAETAKAAAAALAQTQKEATTERLQADIRLAQAMGNTALAEQLQRDGFIAGLADLSAGQQAAKIGAYDYARAIDAQITAMQDASRGVDTALGAVGRAVEAEKQSIQSAAQAQMDVLRSGMEANQQALQAAQDRVGSLTQLFDDIASAVKKLRADVEPERQLLDARAYIDMSLSLARAGTLPDQDRLAEAISVVTSDQIDLYRSQQDFAFAQKVQAGKLEELGDLAGAQKSVAQLQLDSLEGANQLAQDQIKAIERGTKDQLAAFDRQLDAARAQVDAIKGVDNSVLSVATAVVQLDGAIQALAQARGQTSASVGSVSGAGENVSGAPVQFPGAGQVSSARFEDLRSLVVSAYNSGGSVADVVSSAVAAGFTAADASQLAEAYKLPAFDVGASIIPQDMLAMVHKGEQIIPAAWNPATSGLWRQGGQSSSARLEALVEALIDRVQQLQSRLDSIDGHTARTAEGATETSRTLNRVTDYGNAMVQRPLSSTATA